MIGPKTAKPTRAEETNAYELATLRDSNTCQRCRRDCGPIARDHRQNRQAGNTTLQNLQCLGLACHRWKTEHPNAAIAEGWAVPRYADPAEWPARRWMPGVAGTLRLVWVLYGTYDADQLVTVITDQEAMRRMGREVPDGCE